jgi:hypothetical protein
MSSPPFICNLHGIFQIPSDLVVKCGGRLRHACRGEDLASEPPVSCRDFAAFDFHAPLTCMLGPTLTRHQVLQVCPPRETRLLASTGMMAPRPRESWPLASLMGLGDQGASHRPPRVGEHRRPAGLRVLAPLPHACAVGRSSRGGDVVRKAAPPLAPRPPPAALPLARPEHQGVAR